VIEPIAHAVPMESLYVRCERIENLEWFSSIVEEWGMELNAFMSVRGMKYDVRERLQEQLCLSFSDLARQLSSVAVQDIAVVGQDPFVREGSGLGILFHARSSDALQLFLMAERQKYAADHDDTTLVSLTIDGFDNAVSLLSSPDNRVRSFLVASGDFHLITTSKSFVKRFLQTCAEPDGSLGASKEFRYARTLTPVDRNDAAFVYLSDAFFRRLVDPAFRIEMTRRAASEAEMELLELAQLAAKSEGQPCDSIEQLMEQGFLPEGFLLRPDGSRLEVQNGRMLDSLRGQRGTFIPIGDVEVTRATQSEVDGYREFARQYSRIWQWTDPAALAIQRNVENDREHLTLDLHVYPYPRREFAFLDFIQPTTDKQCLAPIPNTLLVAEANIFGSKPAIAGIADFEPPLVIENGVLDPTSLNDNDTPWFLGGHKRLNFFDLFNGRRNKLKEGQIVQLQESDRRMEINWALATNGFEIAAGSQAALQPLVGQLKLTDAERPAEFRVSIGDVSRLKFSRYAHAMVWTQAQRVSEGQTTLLNRLVSQFGVPGESAVHTANHIFHTRLINPFGLAWKTNEPARAIPVPSIDVAIYRSPFLDRFRGAKFELTTEGTTLTTHAEMWLDQME
ncbi:MAG: hypothetical protein KDA96_09550, partial [Planctomycetaceae bacterium]|nr:hypothetical protein [Planctomycetaceae bacterium]